MAESESGPDPIAADARTRSLDERLARAQAAEASRTGGGAKPDEGTRLGNRVLAELLGGMIGGAVIGWTLDWFLGTKPWLLLVLLGLGTAAAFRNIIRISNQAAASSRPPRS
jgi:ATP synthase protein I